MQLCSCSNTWQVIVYLHGDPSPEDGGHSQKSPHSKNILLVMHLRININTSGLLRKCNSKIHLLFYAVWGVSEVMMFEGEISGRPPPTVPRVAGGHDVGLGEHLGYTVSYCTLGRRLPWCWMGRTSWIHGLLLYLGSQAAMMLDGEIIWYTTSYWTLGRRLLWCLRGRLSGIPPPTVPWVAGCYDVGWGDYLVYFLLYLGSQAAMMLDVEII